MRPRCEYRDLRHFGSQGSVLCACSTCITPALTLLDADGRHRHVLRPRPCFMSGAHQGRQIDHGSGLYVVLAELLQAAVFSEVALPQSLCSRSEPLHVPGAAAGQGPVPPGPHLLQASCAQLKQAAFRYVPMQNMYADRQLQPALAGPALPGCSQQQGAHVRPWPPQPPSPTPSPAAAARVQAAKAWFFRWEGVLLGGAFLSGLLVAGLRVFMQVGHSKAAQQQARAFVIDCTAGSVSALHLHVSLHPASVLCVHTCMGHVHLHWVCLAAVAQLCNSQCLCVVPPGACG